MEAESIACLTSVRVAGLRADSVGGEVNGLQWMVFGGVGMDKKLAQSFDILPSKNSRKEDAISETDEPLGRQGSDLRDKRMFRVDQS